MPRLKQLSGKEIIKIFEAHGFEVKRIVGSHVRLTLRQNDSPYHVTIPLHNPVKKGTLHGIVKDFELCFGKDESDRHFLN